MKTNIFRPLRFGKETFHPKSYDENSFIMDWSVEAGGGVPPHLHQHMDEHFTVTKGEVEFTVNGNKIVKQVGETLFVPKGTIHSIKNAGNDQVALAVKYEPCADTHRMFEIIATFDEKKPGSIINMLKYFYISPRLGLKSFSTPQPAAINSVINGIATIIGKVSGWDKLVKQFK